MSMSTVTKNRNLPASYDEFYNTEESNNTLHIYDLTLDVKTEHLASFLSPFAGDYTLRWVDPYNGILIRLLAISYLTPPFLSFQFSPGNL